MNRIMLFSAVVLLATGARAQSPGEISFWESVRNSRNPAELQAYIDQYPNGAFVVLAKSRLAALGATPAAAPQAKPVAPTIAASTPLRPLTPETRFPVAGDTWTYSLTYPRLRGEWGQVRKPPRTYAVTVESASPSAITDQASLDSGTAVTATHAKGAVLLQQGIAIFSPYLQVFQDLPASGRLRDLAIADPGCTGMFLCEAKAVVSGRDTISVRAGTFQAVRITVTEEWRPTMSATAGAAQYQGGRTLTVWYVPELKRAVKYSSRLTAGTVPPMDATFDLELVSYQLK